METLVTFCIWWALSIWAYINLLDIWYKPKHRKCNKPDDEVIIAYSIFWPVHLLFYAILSPTLGALAKAGGWIRPFK